MTHYYTKAESAWDDADRTHYTKTINKKGKGEKPIPDVKLFTNFQLISEFRSNSGWTEFVTTDAECRYHEEYEKALEVELMRRLHLYDLVGM